MNRGYIFIIFATLFFSSMEVMLKPVADVFHPMQINCTRFLIGGILLIPLAVYALRKRNISLVLRDWMEFAWLGFIGLTLSMTLFQASIMYIPASAVSVLISCNPILVVPFAFLIFHTEIKTCHCVALVLEIIAAAMIINPFHTTLNMTGVILVLVSAATFALYAVLGRNQCMKFSGIAVTCFSCLTASVEMLALMALSHWTPVAHILTDLGFGLFAHIPFIDGYTSENIWIVAYICIFVTAGGYACYFMGLEATSPIQGSLVFFFKPILAPLFAMAFLGESVSLLMWCGISVMLTASIFAMMPAPKNYLLSLTRRKLLK